MRKNKPIKLESYFSIASFCLFSLGYFCNPVESRVVVKGDCKAAIENVAKQIHQYGTSIRVVANDKANEGYVGNPTTRDIELLFGIGENLKKLDEERNVIFSTLSNSAKSDAVARNIFYSIKLQQDWSNYLVKECKDLATVTFITSEWIGCGVSFAIQSDGSTKPREPKDNSEITYGAIDWNYLMCI